MIFLIKKGDNVTFKNGIKPEVGKLISFDGICAKVEVLNVVRRNMKPRLEKGHITFTKEMLPYLSTAKTSTK